MAGITSTFVIDSAGVIGIRRDIFNTGGGIDTTFVTPTGSAWTPTQPVNPYVRTGGNKNIALTATGAAKAAAGRLNKIIVTTVLGAGAITIYDNASAASGTVLFVIPAATAAGSIFSLDLPAVNGIYASFASTGTILVSYD